MTHDKAIEAALDAYYNDGGANEEEHRQKMRRAVAAFLRAWEPTLQGAPIREPFRSMIGEVSRITADELEGNDGADELSANARDIERHAGIGEEPR